MKAKHKNGSCVNGIDDYDFIDDSVFEPPALLIKSQHDLSATKKIQ